MSSPKTCRVPLIDNYVVRECGEPVKTERRCAKHLKQWRREDARQLKDKRFQAENRAHSSWLYAIRCAEQMIVNAAMKGDYKEVGEWVAEVHSIRSRS